MRSTFLLLFVLFSVISQLRAQEESNQFLEKYLAVSQAMEAGKEELTVRNMLHLYATYKDHEWEETDDVNGGMVLASVVSMVVMQYPNNASIKEFQRKELPRYIKKTKKNGSPEAQQMLGMLSMLPMLQHTEKIEKVRAAISWEPEYPNALDKEEGTSELALSFIRRLSETIPLEALNYCNAVLENQLLSRAAEYEDALGSYVARYHRESVLVEELLNYTLHREHFKTERRRKEQLATELAGKDGEFNQLRREFLAAEKQLVEDLNTGRKNTYTYHAERQKLIEGAYCEQLSAAHQPERAPRWQDLQKKLKTGEAIVRIYRTIPRKDGVWWNKIQYGAVIIHPDNMQPKYVMIPGSDSLEFEKYRDFQEEVFSFPTGESYLTFWGALESELQGISKLYFSADGIYGRINPALLYHDEVGRYVFEDMTVVQLAALGSILESPIQTRLKDALLIGNPAFSRQSSAKKSGSGRGFRMSTSLTEAGQPFWGDLPQTQVEVDSAAGILHRSGMKVKMFTQYEATEERLARNEASPDLLHLATHAYFTPFADVISTGDFPGEEAEESSSNYASVATYLRDEKGRWGVQDSLALLKYYNDTDQVKAYADLMNSPEGYRMMSRRIEQKSGIVLAGSNEVAGKSDGILTQKELESLDLNRTDVVIMSACDIGKQELSDTGELGGFRAILRAKGVKYLVSSLWPVQDRAGMEFITAFYGYWFSSQQSIEEAFTLAQRDIHQRGESLYAWGGFILTKL